MADSAESRKLSGYVHPFSPFETPMTESPDESKKISVIQSNPDGTSETQITPFSLQMTNENTDTVLTTNDSTAKALYMPISVPTPELRLAYRAL